MTRHEEPAGAHDMHEEPAGADDMHEEPAGAHDMHEEPAGAYDMHEEPAGAYDMHEEPAGAHDMHEEPAGAHDMHEEHAGAHDKHEGHNPEMFRDRLLVSLLLTAPILYFSEQFQDWFNYEAVSFPGSEWVAPILATFLFIYAGGVFLQGGYRELRARQPGMMTLISMPQLHCHD